MKVERPVYRLNMLGQPPTMLEGRDQVELGSTLAASLRTERAAELLEPHIRPLPPSDDAMLPA